MSKIHDLGIILEDRRKKDQLKLNSQRVESLKRVVQCSMCRFKCSMCGIHIESYDKDPCQCGAAQSGLNLCPGCRSEFDDYSREQKDGQEEALFWHNEEWRRLWSTWLLYQQALLSFRKSNEIKRFSETIKEQP